MKILHVTEAMGSGVLHLVQSLSRRQAEQGAEISLWFAARPETPADEALEHMFDSRVSLRRFGAPGSSLRSHLALARAVRAASKSRSFDVIHLHSSKAGVLGRVATWSRSSRKAAVVYSPHGFAFLRDDMGRFLRGATRRAESLLAKQCDGLVLSAPSEERLTSDFGPERAPTYVLKTGVPAHHLRNRPRLSRHDADKKLRVAMVGRVCYQKAPWRFASVARQLGAHADFVWIGDGAPDDLRKWLQGSEVRVTGWLPTEELARQLDDVDVLLFPTLWEGMALSLMQAQAQGIPAVVSDVVGNVDTVVHGETGFVCSDDDELVQAVEKLLFDQDLRDSMSDAAIAWAQKSLLDTDLGTESLSIYRSVRELRDAN